jgi:hypothetical protein
MLARALSIALLTLAAAAPAAGAAPWKQLTADGSNIDQVAPLRTADGVLHVAWHHETSPSTADLLHTAISPKGSIGATTPIQRGWTGFENAALVPAPGGGIRVFFGAIRSLDSSDPNQDLNTALSTDGGTSWALTPGSIVPRGGQAYGSPVSAATLGDGTPLQTWAGTLGTWVHAGLSPARPLHDFQAPLGHYGYDPGMAAAGQTAAIAWYSNATGHLGVYAAQVGADGAAAGPLMHMPDTGDMSVGMIGRTPIVARPGGGFYVAYATGYPAFTAVRLWRVGAGSAPAIARPDRNASTTATIAAAPDGRLWVVWKDTAGDHPEVFARRSDPEARRFGAVVRAGAPPKAFSLYRLDASAAPGGGLDVFGAFTRGLAPAVSTFYKRILPGLTLKASRAKLRRGDKQKVTFKVTDAGDPVKGAKVKAGGDSGRTNRRGKVTLRVNGKGRAVRARATHGGYTAGAKKLRVKKR